MPWLLRGISSLTLQFTTTRATLYSRNGWEGLVKILPRMAFRKREGPAGFPHTLLRTEVVAPISVVSGCGSLAVVCFFFFADVRYDLMTSLEM